MLRRTKFNVSIDVCSKMSGNRRKSRASKTTWSKSLDLVIQMTLMNPPKRNTVFIIFIIMSA